MKNKPSIIWYDSVDSTNDEARRLISGIDNLSVLAAEHQTAGRGQRGNKWSGGFGENLTFSLVLKFGTANPLPEDSLLPAMFVRDQFSISEMTTVAVSDFLAGKGIRAEIKWPNDIYVGNKKICGMLVESGTSGQLLEYSIVGIGINVNQTVFPPELVNPVSMSAITKRNYVIKDLLIELSECLCSLLPMISDEDGRGVLMEKYLSRLYRKGLESEYFDCLSGKRFMGTITGITDQALLRVKLADGSVKDFSFKEISYII